MYKTLLSITAAMLVATTASNGQNQRRAVMMGGGTGDRGKCTIEVVVDGAAEVEIRGDNATLRNLSGQAPQFRRFQCTGPMPANPANFRFSGVDGRGRQELVGDPRNGGPAVVRIEDPDNGSEGYTFDVTWSGSDQNPANRYPGAQSQGSQNPVAPYPGGRNANPGDRNPGSQYPASGGQYPAEQDRNRPAQERDDRDRYQSDDRHREGDRPFTRDQAIRICQDAVRDQAAERFHARDIDFRRTGMDDSPGRRDWVMGTFEIRRANDRGESFRFSCSINFDSGRVRSADIQPLEDRR